MTNQYFNHDNPLTRHTNGRAEEVNGVFEAIAAGFDLLPDADEFGENQYVQDTGAANAYVVTLDPNPLSYYEGLRLLMKAVNANTAASTINANGIGVKPIKRYNGDDLQANDITAGMIVYLIYDGTNFRIVSAHGADVALAQSWATSTSVVSGGLKGARGYAQDASTSASAASSSASSASSSAASALSSYQSFIGTYYGPLSSDPTLDPNGNAPGAGDWYFNTSTIQSRIYSGSAWGNVAAVLTGMEDGTAANPGLPFASDLDTGIFRSGANRMGFSAGGIMRLELHSSGVELSTGQQLLLPDGAAASPSLCFGSDADVGLYRPGVNLFGLTVGGTTVLSASPTAVSTHPGVQLQINDGSLGTLGFSFFNDLDTGIYRSGANDMRFVAGGVAKFSVATNVACESGAILFVSDGNATLPGIAFNGDSNTGIYRSAVDTVAFACGGSGVAAISTTLADFGNLKVSAGAGISTAPSYSFTSDSNTGMYSNSADVLEFAAGGSMMFVLNNVTNAVAIGKSGGSNLQVNALTSPSASAGAGGGLPATTAEYLIVLLNGATRKIPCYLS